MSSGGPSVVRFINALAVGENVRGTQSQGSGFARSYPSAAKGRQ